MELITKADELPPLERTQQVTLYKGQLPVIIFTDAERRDYENTRSAWAGWPHARELARAHFEAEPACEVIHMLFMHNPSSASYEAGYGGSYLRRDFAEGGRYAPKKGAQILNQIHVGRGEGRALFSLCDGANLFGPFGAGRNRLFASEELLLTDPEARRQFETSGHPHCAACRAVFDRYAASTRFRVVGDVSATSSGFRICGSDAEAAGRFSEMVEKGRNDLGRPCTPFWFDLYVNGANRKADEAVADEIGEFFDAAARSGLFR